MDSGVRLRVGYVARPHGVKGELRVVLHDAASTVLGEASRVWIGGEEHKVTSARPVNGAFLLAIEGIDDRSQAEKLRSLAVEVDRDLVALAPGEFLLDDLVGCRVAEKDGTALGTVTSVMVGRQCLMVIRSDGIERLLPIVPELILAVDTEEKLVTVVLPDDLPTYPETNR
ncbi:MAG: ribosome maturation factor RimM [Pseudomonadota bacterium]